MAYKMYQILAAPVKTTACYYVPEEIGGVYRADCPLYALCRDDDEEHDGESEVRMLQWCEYWDFADESENFLGFEIDGAQQTWEKEILRQQKKGRLSRDIAAAKEKERGM